MTSITIHRVMSMELTKPNSLESGAGLFWRRNLKVIDENGNKVEISLFAEAEWQLEIKEPV